MRFRLAFAGFLSFALTVSAAQVSTTSQTSAQKGTIGGVVVKAGTSEPLRKALVTLQPGGRGQGPQNALVLPGLTAAPGQVTATGQAAATQQGQQQRGGQGQPGGGAKSVVTGDDGAFGFADLDAGQY